MVWSLLIHLSLWICKRLKDTVQAGWTATYIKTTEEPFEAIYCFLTYLFLCLGNTRWCQEPSPGK